MLAKHNKLIIIGDLNAKSKLWHCNTENKRGTDLEQLICKLDMHVLKSSSPTYPTSNSVLDLSICSSSLRTSFLNFQVLSDQISDHYPTLTSFKLSIDKLTFEINKLDLLKL